MTMSNVINFGSVLQTYATIKSVEKAGAKCVLINYDYPSPWHTSKAIGAENKSKTGTPALRKFIKIVLRTLGLLFYARAAKRFIDSKKTERRQAEFQALLSNVNTTSIKYNRKSIMKNPPQFDIFMTGSDQTWNPRFLHTDYSFLLNFVPDNAPKIAYSASFGAKKILPEYRNDYMKYLRRYDRISVREPSGIPLVKELTGKDAVHTPDPTLMLNKEEWCQKIKSKLELPEKFIFAYILNYVFDPYPQIDELLKHLSKISGMPVVFVGEGAVKMTDDDIVFTADIGPDGFLECFKRACFVVTTSFHGTAFSVNFEKDFFAVLNPNATIDDRVKSFLESVDLGSRGLILSNTNISAITVKDMTVDHTVSAERLQKMREVTLDYLTEVLALTTPESDVVQDE